MSNVSPSLDLSTELEVPISTGEPDIESMKESPVQQSRKRSLLLLFNHHQQHKSSKTSTINQNNSPVGTTLTSESSKTAPYVYIDHAKTTTLKDIANERLQHQQQTRRIEI
jgi:hypothetical protein